MNLKIKHLIISFLASASISYLLNSCSLVGFSMGAAVDSKTPKTTRLSYDQIDTLEFGKHLEVTKNNGDTVCGKFKGILPFYNDYFHREYDSIKNALFYQVQLPDLNDTLLIIYSRENNLKKLGIFKGFESESLWCEYVYGEDFFNVDLTSIEGIRINDHYNIDSEQISEYILTTQFPNFLNIDIKIGKKQSEMIELASVKNIIVTDKQNRKFIGLGVGLAVDLIVAFIVINENFDPELDLSF